MTKKLILKELDRYSIGTYADVIYRNALFRGNQEAFIYKEIRITFAGFNERVNSLIHALHSMGLKKGDGIGILSWNCLECTDITGAAMKGGFIVSPFNPRMQKNELEYLINYSEAKVLFVGPELMQMANELRPVLKNVTHYVALEQKAENMAFHEDLLASHSKEEPDVDVKETDPFIIFYTSGTTGMPPVLCIPISGRWKKQKQGIQVGLKPCNKIF
jgi:acyl-coenzyme A synthetase/AMP-(fatty) acid ligase